MKVLFIIPGLTFGGVQTQTYLQAKYFKNELNLDVEIWGVYSISDNFIAILKRDGIDFEFRPEINFFYSRKYKSLSYINKIRKWNEFRIFLSKRKFDVLMPKTYRIEKVINFIWGFTSAKLSFGFELEGKPFPIIPKFDPYRLIAKIFEPIYVANSDHGRKIMSMKRRLKLEQIKVIRNTYVPREKVLNNEIWKKCLKKEKNSKIVTMIANFFNPKDHITVIKAWSKLDKKHNAKLVFAGKGRVKDCLKNYHNATSLVESLHLQDSVYFLDEVEDVNSLLSITDVGLLSSRSEGCPNVLLEYMGAHLPIIGTDIPGIQEIIPDIQKQYLFEVGDIEECAKKINFLLSNKLEAEVAGKKNYEYLLKNFYNNDMYEHYTTILKSKGIVA